ncbi:LEAF RUST 10 DISEASE-RESISTANCE LOCUS RECEPTOR-LIKE PROTEIN KINASE-like 1.1 isoform X1 [Syzygium oleosum]|uniref:LEAF RUST 10 DISEASE-RESISTANCE LOCUS RECEPTOR-LIKE PROTEIN KINASE-like 1.1 isoform X1 n=1 Tax=Syzygium oleosum TaxID=219896 RepID=UPI0024BA168F|nr:LEAF RUST 10 DISEASE-RESISTANCE LOCUS RECEPTOR-LIKE PROTEIN KINASE-like 1.1 isoform X1 [Syzygium oleosum]
MPQKLSCFCLFFVLLLFPPKFLKMGVESSMSSKVLLRLVISVLTIISLEDWVASESLKDGHCEGGKCGDVIKDCYFWNDTKPCPNFHSECHEKPVFNLKPSFGEYVVDYDNQTLRSSSEFERTGNACFAPIEHSPKPSGGSDTHVSRFKLPSSLKSDERPSYLAFLHYCSSSPNVDYLNPHSTCPSGGANRSYVALIVDIQEVLYLNLSVCQSHVIVPVELERKDRDKPENVDSDDNLKDGIRLKWNLTSWESCVKCKESGGKCREPDGSFQCFCSGKAYPRTCKRGNNQARLKIGLGSGIGALAIICLCLCIYRIRYRQQHSFLKFRSRHASSKSSLKADLEVGNVYFEVPIFTNGELEEATNYFDSARELGDGGFGTVYFGKLRDGREVAVKRLYERNYRRVKQFMTEVQILTRLRHRNLVSLYGCTSQHSHELLLVYEYIPNGTVADHLHGERAKQDPLLWPTRISIAIETATALAYLHASDTIHRDVKTNNILLDNNFSVKVADFGLSRLFPNDVSHVSTAPQGTPGYVDPEYHQCYQLTEKSDVYSFGVVLVELISSMPAVDISRDRHEINLANLATSKIRNRAFHELIDPNLGFESDPEINRMIMAVAELAFRCLQQDKDLRPSMGTVLEELKAISSGTHEPDKSKDVSDDNSAGQGKNPPPSPECDDAGLLKNMKSPTSPVSVTQKWGSSGSSSVHSG